MATAAGRTGPVRGAADGRAAVLISPDQLPLVTLVVSGILLLGAGAVWLSSRLGMPSLLLYLGIGLAIGESGLGVQFEDFELAQVVCSIALALILAEGGLTTRMEDMRPVAGLSVVLATVGVGISVAVTSGLAWLLLDVDVRTAVLLGAVVSSTDAAAVFAVMRTMRLPTRISATLEAESGLNDPPVIVLVTLVASDLWFDFHAGSAILGFTQQMLVGALAGLMAGAVGWWVLPRAPLPASGLYPLAALSFCMLGFGLADPLGGSPFVAVYVAGLVLGAAPLPHRVATLGFAEGMAWLAQISLFVVLGLLASPDRLGDAIVPALVVGTALTFVARPVSVLLCATPFRFGPRQQAFMSWAGLRGAVPIVLATFPMTGGLPHAERIFDVTFLLVVVFTLVQGPTLPFVARILRVNETLHTRALAVEHAYLGDLGAEVLSLDVPVGSRLHGVEVGELRLPNGSAVSLILRDGSWEVPTPRTGIRTGDNLVLVVSAERRAEVEARLREVNRGGRLARWYGHRVHPEPPRLTPPPAPSD